jgi:sec-independent protein translocase protein TatA
MNTSLLFIGNLGGGEWIVIILVVVLLFGGKKIPELMRGVGQGIREFNDAKKNVKSQIEEGMKEKDNQPPTIVGKCSSQSSYSNNSCPDVESV